MRKGRVGSIESLKGDRVRIKIAPGHDALFVDDALMSEWQRSSSCGYNDHAMIKVQQLRVVVGQQGRVCRTQPHSCANEGITDCVNLRKKSSWERNAEINFYLTRIQGFAYRSRNSDSYNLIAFKRIDTTLLPRWLDAHKNLWRHFPLRTFTMIVPNATLTIHYSIR